MSSASSRTNVQDYTNALFQQQKLAMAATETIWHRSIQMALGQMSPMENMAMWMEKPTAMFNGFENASIAAVAGKSPLKVMQAALEPMTSKASSNAKRLRR